MGAALRVWLLGLLAVAMGALALTCAAPSRPLGADAPAGEFSATRAGAILKDYLGDEKPRPAGSARNARAHAWLMDYLAAHGMRAQTLSGMSCGQGRAGIFCATVNDIVAEALPGPAVTDEGAKAIVLMAHLDSVPAGPGASDDGSGVATILETVRALKAAGAEGRHPVILLITDGEEYGLLGANLFLRDPAQRSKVGVVVNVEARGASGPSYLFQTSANDQKLVELYAQSVARPATSSLYNEIYKYLPNDTDLTPFLRAGLTGYNFAFIGNVAVYHTALDTDRVLDPATLQAQGDNVLGLTRGLERTDFAALAGGGEIYFDLLGRFLPRVPAGWALPLALLAFLLIALAGRPSRQAYPEPRSSLALLMPPLLIAGCVAMGYVLAGLAGLISGESDPSFAHPLALRVSLAAGCWSIALLIMRRARPKASWLWLAGLGIVTAVAVPGLSPYFIFPSLLAGLLFLLTMMGGRGAALLLAAALALLVWVGFAANGEAIMGLKAHVLFTVPVAFGLITLLPLMAAQKMGNGPRRLSVAVSLLVALGAAVVAGFEPAYTPQQPERLNLRYVEKDGNAWVLADPVSRLPNSLRAVADFSQTPQFVEVASGYSVLAGDSQFTAPSAGVSRRGNSVFLDVYGSRSADGMALIVPGGLKSVTIDGLKMQTSPGPLRITCGTPDCARSQIVLDFSAVPGKILLVEQRYGLPPRLDFLKRARPDWAVPSQLGDLTDIAEDMAVPGGF